MNIILLKQIITTIIFIIAAFLVSYLINHSLIKMPARGMDTRKKKTVIGLMKNIVKYTIAIITILAILDVYDVKTTTILASIGLLGLVIGLALQDVIKAFLAGFFIIFDDQYSVGDTITLNGFKGEVVALGLKTTKVRADNGDVKSISNNFITEIINHTENSPTATVDINLSYDNDLEKADEILNKIIAKLDGTLQYTDEDITLLSFNNYSESGVEFRLTVATEPNKSDEVARIIRKEIHKVFNDNNIKFAHPQVMFNDGKRI